MFDKVYIESTLEHHTSLGQNDNVKQFLVLNLSLTLIITKVTNMNNIYAL